MKYRTTRSLSFLFAIVSGGAAGADVQAVDVAHILQDTGFAEVPLPTRSPCRLALPTFYIEKIGGRVEVTQTRPAVIDSDFFGSNILYSWENHGEWGGAVVAAFPDGKRSMLVRDTVVDVKSGLGTLAVFSGIYGRGAIYEIDDMAKNPRAVRTTLLPLTPEIVVADTRRVDMSRFYIVSHRGLMSYSSPDVIEIHAWAPRWFSGTPTSAEFHGDQLVIGYRGGVGVFDEYSEQGLRWFVPDN